MSASNATVNAGVNAGVNATATISNANKAAANKAAANKKAANNAAFAELTGMSNAVAPANGSNSKPAGNAVGGRRRTKRAKSSKRGTQKGGKISKGASKWNQFVMRTFKDMRKKNKSVKLMDAMKECSKQKKKGVKY
jgi:hypothetical protein